MGSVGENLLAGPYAALLEANPLIRFQGVGGEAWWAPSEEQLAFGFLTFLALIFGYWIPNLFLVPVYKFGLFPHLRIAPPGAFPDAALIRECVSKNLVNTFISLPLVGVYLLYRPCAGNILAPPPSILTLVWQFWFQFLWADCSFYWLHRLFHHRLLYKRFHKQHHSFRWTIGLAANHATPMEEIMVNFNSTFIGCLMLAWCFGNVHALSIIIYLTIRFMESVEEHSGYVWPYSPWYPLRTNEFHAYHHSHNVGNYGTLPFWDWICGTDRHFRAYKQKQAESKAK